MKLIWQHSQIQTLILTHLYITDIIIMTMKYKTLKRFDFNNKNYLIRLLTTV